MEQHEAQIGLQFALSPAGEPRVVLLLGTTRVELDAAAARLLASAVYQVASDAEAAALLRSAWADRWGVNLPIPDALALVLRRRMPTAPRAGPLS